MPDPSKLRVIIPVGGEARRLRPLTADVSKAVVRIFNRPLVEFAMRELARQGVKDFIFGAKGYVNYKSLFDYFREGIGFSAQYAISPRIHIKYQPRIDDVGSADSVRVNIEYYNIKETLLVVQGDNLFRLDLTDVLRFMEEKKAFMVVVLMAAEDVEAYGIADLDEEARIRRFVEKPKREEAPSRLANTGIYVISPRVKDVYNEPQVQEMINVKKRLDFGLDFIPYLISRGYPVYGYWKGGEWYDVGTPKAYLDTVRNVLNSREGAPFYLGKPVPNLGNLWIQGYSPESVRRRRETLRRALEKKIRIEGSAVIGRHCQIGDGTIIRESCIDNFCILGRDVTVERSAIMDRVVLGDRCYVQDSIIGRHVRIRSSKDHPTWVVGLSVIGDDVEIGAGREIVSMRVDPHTVVPENSSGGGVVMNASSTPSVESRPTQ